MADRAIDRLLEIFLEASGSAGRNLEKPEISSGSIAETQHAEAPQNEGSSVLAELYGSSANPADTGFHASGANGGESSGGGSGAGSAAMTFLESGLGVVSIVRGLMGLFGGGDGAPAPLQRYEMPPAIDFASVESAAGLSGATYDQSGAARAVSRGHVAEAQGEPARSAGPQITVNVQTMDAQSFLDHSAAIAQAVRGAMLNSNSLNDVVSEL
jgi:hypothetical protein